jgi:predicted AlkP superfamily phosphohydrolase/phosphomutase
VKRSRSSVVIGAVAAAILLLWARDALAYVGPGAGIAIATTALAFVVSLVLALFGILFWPIRYLWRRVMRRRAPRPARVRRAVLIGLDGLDPVLARRFMADGKLPHMARLASMGGFQNLATTFPAMSPVAWSSFATGVHPAKHGIYDFLVRDPKTYLPDLSSAEVKPPRRHLHLGKYRVPLGRPEIRLLRKSKPFWKILGQYQVPCSILRVPITFPPESFEGTLLSAMCVPDLEGSQGSFSYFTTLDDAGDAIGGRRTRIKVEGDRIESRLWGPGNPLRKDAARLSLPFSLHLDRERRRATLKVGREKVRLEVGQFSEWVPIAFPLLGAGAFGPKLRGICRFRLLQLDGAAVRLYASPINIDPENPVMPISHPKFFAVFLAKLFGRYATLGLAEDTWALNEKVLDEDAFLEQAWANHEEREAQFFEMLKRTPRGLITCVFDGTDRIQHMFMRYLDDGHPALGDDGDAAGRARFGKVIEDTYARMDTMLGMIMREVDPQDSHNFVAVLSDHGFQTFRRGVNVNSWLLREGYLVLKDGRTSTGEWFEGVDWTRSRAFALGLGGVFLNVKGREAFGVVEPEAARALADEIAARLTGLVDTGTGQVGIREAYAAHTIYKGPYAEDAPDLIIGYAAGWRASWDGVRGIADGTIFDDNTKAWSGDHCIDPELVPGVLIANRQLGRPDRGAGIADLAPTMLDLFGVDAPRYMDGRTLLAS